MSPTLKNLKLMRMTITFWVGIILCDLFLVFNPAEPTIRKDESKITIFVYFSLFMPPLMIFGQNLIWHITGSETQCSLWTDHVLTGQIQGVLSSKYHSRFGQSILALKLVWPTTVTKLFICPIELHRVKIDQFFFTKLENF